VAAAFNGQAFNFPAEANFLRLRKSSTRFEIGFEDGLMEPARRIQRRGFSTYDYKNQQFLDAFHAGRGGAGSGFHTVNAPKSRRRRRPSFEFRAKARPTTSKSARRLLGLLHSKYVRAGRCTRQRRPATCCVGNQLIQAPALQRESGASTGGSHEIAGRGPAVGWWTATCMPSKYFRRIQHRTDSRRGRMVSPIAPACRSRATAKRGFGAGPPGSRTSANRKYPGLRPSTRNGSGHRYAWAFRLWARGRNQGPTGGRSDLPVLTWHR